MFHRSSIPKNNQVVVSFVPSSIKVLTDSRFFFILSLSLLSVVALLFTG